MLLNCLSAFQKHIIVFLQRCIALLNPLDELLDIFHRHIGFLQTFDHIQLIAMITATGTSMGQRPIGVSFLFA